MTAVRLGRVCTRRRARIHLALDGRTCGAARGASIGYEVTRPDLAQPGNLCRRCFTPNRVGRAQELLYTATGSPAARIRSLLVDVVDGWKTPEQRAQENDLIARINATIDAAAPVLALPVDERPRTWAALRDEYAKTHPQPVAA